MEKLLFKPPPFGHMHKNMNVPSEEASPPWFIIPVCRTSSLAWLQAGVLKGKRPSHVSFWTVTELFAHLWKCKSNSMDLAFVLVICSCMGFDLVPSKREANYFANSDFTLPNTL